MQKNIDMFSPQPLPLPQKIITKSSGYLDDQYELSPDFRQVQDYHFRIEDDAEIRELENLWKMSMPMENGFNLTAHGLEGQFCNKMAELSKAIDRVAGGRDRAQKGTQTHGYYQLKDNDYDQKKTLQAAHQHLQMNSLTKRMENLTIDNKKIKFKNKGKTNKNIGISMEQDYNQYSKDSQMREQKQQGISKQMTKKMKNLSINDIQL